MFPPKLRFGDEVRIIAPSRSLAILADDLKQVANTRLDDLSLKLPFGDYVNEVDELNST